METDDHRARYELRDAAAFIGEVASRHRLTDGTTLLALVHQPATTQRLLAVRELPPQQRTRGRDHDLSELLYDEVSRLDIPKRSDHSTSILVTVIVRRGRNGWGPLEQLWSRAWRYSNHNSDAFDLDIFVVTEHGWCSLWSDAGGAQPALVD